MSRHDGKTNAKRSYITQLHRAISRYLPHQGLRLLPADDKERWTPRYLAITALLMALLGTEKLIDRFHAARHGLIEMYGTRRRPGGSYQGFVYALTRRGDALLKALIPHLRRQMKQIAGPRWWIMGWEVFGGDGSRYDKPRTRANQETFGRGGRNKTGPQEYLTQFFHVAMGLPWCWRTGRADASERSHLRDMLGELPLRAMLLLDAGFTGYDLLKNIIDSGRWFVVRVGRNVELIRDLGYYRREGKGIVYLWPQHALGRGRVPLVLRLVTVIDARGRRMYLLTNVLSRTKLSDAAVARMYRLRWGVEVLFRTIKQTMDLDKAGSWTPAAAHQELEWGMMGVWLLGLLSLENQLKGGKGPAAGAPAGPASHPPDPTPAIDPARKSGTCQWTEVTCGWSPAKALRLIRRVIHGSLLRGPSLKRQLKAAVKDGYRRRGSKKAIDWPHKKREKPPGEPRTRRATKGEIKQAAALPLAA